MPQINVPFKPLIKEILITENNITENKLVIIIQRSTEHSELGLNKYIDNNNMF